MQKSTTISQVNNHNINSCFRVKRIQFSKNFSTGEKEKPSSEITPS